jgi:hypothetical protein
MQGNLKQTAFFMFMTFACSIGLSVSAAAQETTGTINGTVRDATGAAIPGATVFSTGQTINANQG